MSSWNREHPSKNELASLVDYNKEDGLIRWKISPRYGIYIGSVAGCLDDRGYITVRIKRRAYRAHRLAWFITYGYWPKEIDHINRDKTDNRIENLRDTD